MYSGELGAILKQINEVRVDGLYRRNHALYDFVICTNLAFNLCHVGDDKNSLLFVKRAYECMASNLNEPKYAELVALGRQYVKLFVQIIQEKPTDNPEYVEYLINKIHE